MESLNLSRRNLCYCVVLYFSAYFTILSFQNNGTSLLVLPRPAAELWFWDAVRHWVATTGQSSRPLHALMATGESAFSELSRKYQINVGHPMLCGNKRMTQYKLYLHVIILLFRECWLASQVHVLQLNKIQRNKTKYFRLRLRLKPLLFKCFNFEDNFKTACLILTFVLDGQTNRHKLSLSSCRSQKYFYVMLG